MSPIYQSLLRHQSKNKDLYMCKDVHFSLVYKGKLCQAPYVIMHSPEICWMRYNLEQRVGYNTKWEKSGLQKDQHTMNTNLCKNLYLIR